MTQPANSVPGAVLIVDDDADVCANLSALLVGEGYAVEVAASGPEAIAAVERTRFRVVLLDIALQQIDGVHLARYLRKRWPLVKIAIHSGAEEADVRARFSDYDAYLLKSGPMAGLLATVGRLAA